MDAEHYQMPMEAVNDWLRLQRTL